MSHVWADFVPPDRTIRPMLEPIFGCKPYTPQTTCDDIHPGGKIPRGSTCCCMAPIKSIDNPVDCHQSGYDHRLLHGEPVGSMLDPDYDVDVIPTVYAPPDYHCKSETVKQRIDASRSLPMDLDRRMEKLLRD